MAAGSRSFVLASMLGSLLLLAPPLVWAICEEEASRYFDKGTQVSQKYTNSGKPCEQDCLEEKRYFYRRAIELCPAHVEAHNNLGNVLEQLGRYPEAYAHYTKALELDPQFAVAYFSLGDLYFRTGEYAKAIETYDKGLSIDPDDQLTLMTLTRKRQALCLKDQAVPPSECIRDVLGGKEREIMGKVGIKEDWRLPIHIPFAYNEDTLLPEAQKPLHELGTALKDTLKTAPSAAFLIEGHTDMQGAEEYNLALSVRRARRVAQALVTNFAIPANKVGIKGFGKTRPLRSGSSEADHARNRRVEIVRIEDKELSLYQSIERLDGAMIRKPTSLVLDTALFYEDGESRPRKLEEGVVLHSGGGYRLYFAPQQPCFVYAFQIDSSGKLFPLYPSADSGAKEPSVQAGQTYWAPSRTQWFELDDTQGQEEIYVVASRERREDLEDLLARSVHAAENGASAQTQQEATIVIKESTRNIMGGRIRKKRNTSVAADEGKPVLLSTDQLTQNGNSFVYKVSFRHN